MTKLVVLCVGSKRRLKDVNEIKEYRRNLVKKLLEQEKAYAGIAYLIDCSQNWIWQLHKSIKKDATVLTQLAKPGGSKCRLSPEDLENTYYYCVKQAKTNSKCQKHN